MIFFYSYDLPIGNVTLMTEDDKLISLLWENSQKLVGIKKETRLIKRAYQELMKYLAGKRQTFSIPLNPKGTSFQQKVWKELEKIPYGETISYQELATRLGNFKAARAVGFANHQNPLPIFIPCHRVIGKNKKLGGYKLGLDLKNYLLRLEKNNL